MHRRRLKALLAEYRRRWPQESATVARFNVFIDSHPDCFHRSCRVGHITGSAWVVDTTGERVVLTHHAKLGRWLQPGGHSDGDPDTRAVALREAREESGLDVRALDDGNRSIRPWRFEGLHVVNRCDGRNFLDFANQRQPSIRQFHGLMKGYNRMAGYRQSPSRHSRYRR